MIQVRAVVGDEEVSGLSDQTLKDCLWEFFFDVERTIQWAVGWSIWSKFGSNELKRVL